MYQGRNRYGPIKIFDGMVRKLKDIRYIAQLKRNLISVGALEALGLEISIRDGVLKMRLDGCFEGCLMQ